VLLLLLESPALRAALVTGATLTSLAALLAESATGQMQDAPERVALKVPGCPARSSSPPPVCAASTPR
jgi:hypothetical protein